MENSDSERATDIFIIKCRIRKPKISFDNGPGGKAMKSTAAI